MVEGNGSDQAEVEFKRDSSWSIHQRIHAVMGDIGHIEKDKEIKGRSGDVMYDYISHDAVSAAVRVPFRKYGVVVVPAVTGHTNDGNRVELTVAVDFINIDKPEDKVTVNTIGYGVDPTDKGPGKALSYAVKYAYLKLLMLNSADDIELDDIKHQPASGAADASSAARQAQETWATNFKTLLDQTTTLNAIDELQKENTAMLMSVPDTTRDYFITRIENRKASMQAEVDRQMEEGE